MSTRDDGAPAFPTGPCHDKSYRVEPDLSYRAGMTLRDYFAAKAVQSITSVLSQGIRPADLLAMSRDAYAIADAMLEARKK